MAKIRDSFTRMTDNAFADFQRRPRVPPPYEGADTTGMPANLEAAETSALRRLSPRRSRWRDVSEFDERVAELDRRQAAATERLRELREQYANEPQRHADRLAAWELQARKGNRPESAAEHLERQIRETEAELEGLDAAVSRVLADKAAYVTRHRARLTQDADRATKDAHKHVVRLIEELAAARASLTQNREAALWASLYPAHEAGTSPRQNVIAGGLAKPVKDTLGIDAQIEHERVLRALRADADYWVGATTAEQRAAMGDTREQRLERDAVWEGTPEGREAERAERKAQRERYASVWGEEPPEFSG